MLNSLSSYFRSAKWTIDPDTYLNSKVSNKPPYVFVHFTDILKLGINPSTGYLSTPIGIYCYPLNNEIYKSIEGGELPFATDKKYVYFFKAKGGSVIYTSKNITVANYKKIIQKLLSKNFEKEWKSVLGSNFNNKKAKLSFIEDSKLSSPIKNNIGYLWNIARLLANGSPAVWAIIFIKLGISGIVDDKGIKVIHPNEPIQAIFFSLKSIETLRAEPNVFSSDAIYRRKLKNIFTIGSNIKDKEIETNRLNTKNIKDITFTNCTITINSQITFSNTKFESCDVTTVLQESTNIFNKCEFKKCSIFVTRKNNSKFIDCKFIDCKFIDCKFTDCTFTAKLSRFIKNVVKRVSFRNCYINKKSKESFIKSDLGANIKNDFKWKGYTINSY